jgi:general secretion pathway protein I
VTISAWIITLTRMIKNTVQSGFTFLEVMIAVAVIAIALVTLIGSQSQSVSIATLSRQNVTASFLAQQKLAELESTPFDELYSGDGDFDGDFSLYRWKAEVNILSAEDTGIEGADDMLKTIDLSIFAGENDQPIYGVRSIVMKRIVPRKT